MEPSGKPLRNPRPGDVVFVASTDMGGHIKQIRPDGLIEVRHEDGQVRTYPADRLYRHDAAESYLARRLEAHEYARRRRRETNDPYHVRGRGYNQLRHVGLRVGSRTYELFTWDTGRTDWRGQSVIGYDFRDPKGITLFRGEDFAGSPMHADDSDESLRGLVGFLTLRPGDTDADYFAQYTRDQMDFAQSSDCEYLQLYGMEDSGEPFVDLD